MDDQIKYKARVPRVDHLAGEWNANSQLWQAASVLNVNQFREESSDHRPETTLKLLHDGNRIQGLFQVKDRYVRCVHNAYGSPVFRDSCVEFFIKPRSARGYFNFEFNCGGAFLCLYITDETRVQGAFKEFARMSREDAERVKVTTSMPCIVEPEIAEPTSWWLIFTIPVGILEKHVGQIGCLSGQVWEANAYKCGNDTSHPHWAAWSPVERLNFHMPQCFGELAFE